MNRQIHLNHRKGICCSAAHTTTLSVWKLDSRTLPRTDDIMKKYDKFLVYPQLQNPINLSANNCFCIYYILHINMHKGYLFSYTILIFLYLTFKLTWPWTPDQHFRTKCWKLPAFSHSSHSIPSIPSSPCKTVLYHIIFDVHTDLNTEFSGDKTCKGV